MAIRHQSGHTEVSGAKKTGDPPTGYAIIWWRKHQFPKLVTAFPSPVVHFPAYLYNFSDYYSYNDPALS